MKKRIYAAVAGILIIILIVAFGAVFSVSEVVEVYEDGIEASDLQSGYIAKCAGISVGDNILSINENSAIKNVSDNFPDNSISISDIERVFPNKVIIKITQRIPLTAIRTKEGDYAIADIDFQLNIKTSEADLSSLIFAEGITVDKTFNTPEIKRLREALLAAKAAGFTDEGLAAFVARISVKSETSVIYTLRSGGIITAEGNGEQLKTEFAQKYTQYLALDDILRREANL